jgi:hypothetical protein
MHYNVLLMSFPIPSSLYGFQQPEQARCLSDAAKLYAECLDLNKQILRDSADVANYRQHKAKQPTPRLNVDDLVADERLQKHTDQSHQPILQVLVLDVLTGGNAIGDVQVDEVWWRVTCNRLLETATMHQTNASQTHKTYQVALRWNL